MEQKDMYYNKAEYIETVSGTNYSRNPLKWSIQYVEFTKRGVIFNI